MFNRLGGLFFLINLLRLGNSRNGLVVNFNPASGKLLVHAKVKGFRIHPPRRKRN